ncbi:hypothetical protein ACLOJK_009729 [Asimina triloba]
MADPKIRPKSGRSSSASDTIRPWPWNQAASDRKQQQGCVSKSATPAIKRPAPSITSHARSRPALSKIHRSAGASQKKPSVDRVYRASSSPAATVQHLWPAPSISSGK